MILTPEAAPTMATQNGIDYAAAEQAATKLDGPNGAYKARAVENFRRLRVVIIGAGFSGIYCGIRIPERLRNVDLTIYEKNAGVGGTWYENRYPGCACDIPGRFLINLPIFSLLIPA